MQRRTIFFLIGFSLLILLAAVYLDSMRRNVRIITDRSIPAVRILGDLRDLLSRVQISFLEEQSMRVPRSTEAIRSRRQQLDQAAGLIRGYRETIMSPQGLELCERVSATFDRYRSQTEELLQVETGTEAATEKLRQCVVTYRQLREELAELRNDRMGRVETRISDMDRRTSRLLHSNLVALGALMLAIMVSWFGSRVTSHDAHPL